MQLQSLKAYIPCFESQDYQGMANTTYWKIYATAEEGIKMVIRGQGQGYQIKQCKQQANTAAFL